MLRAILLALTLAWSPAPAGLALSGGGGELDAAVARFRESLGAADAARTSALNDLVALSDPGATPVLAEEYARCSNAMHAARDRAFELGYEIEHRETMLAELLLRADSDASLKSSIPDHQKDLEALKSELAKREKVVAREEPWRTELSEATGRLFEAVGAGKRKSAEKILWEKANQQADLEARLGAIELLGRVGGDGTAMGLHGLLADFAARRAELEHKLPRAEVDARKLEERIQEENRRLGGQLPQSTQEEYDRARAEAAKMRKELTLVGNLLDASVDAAAGALEREQGETQVRSMQALERALDREKGELRLRSLAILGRVHGETIIASLRTRLAAEKEPAAIAQVLTDLAALGDREIVAPILSKWMDHEAWLVQASAVSALAVLRSKEGIGPLIERMATTKGRLRTDIHDALVSLTGQDFHGNQELWKRWWDEHGETFEVSAAPPPRRSLEDAQETLGLTFFGITTESQRVLFILDVSGSMNFSMVARDNPTDEPDKPYDMPRSNEVSRLVAAKKDLLQALGGLKDGAVTNLIVYASDVWSWKDQPTTLEAGTRAELNAYVEALEAVGGTNIYGALEFAFDMAGVEGKGEWERPPFDTIFLLSDGRPSIGVTTDVEEILAFVREKNRAAGIVIHTIGLSGAHNAYLLRNLAEQNGGTYVSH
jgi:hypothetical protein